MRTINKVDNKAALGALAASALLALALAGCSGGGSPSTQAQQQPSTQSAQAQQPSSAQAASQAASTAAQAETPSTASAPAEQPEIVLYDGADARVTFDALYERTNHDGSSTCYAKLVYENLLDRDVTVEPVHDGTANGYNVHVGISNVQRQPVAAGNRAFVEFCVEGSDFGGTLADLRDFAFEISVREDVDGPIAEIARIPVAMTVAG